MREHHTGRQRRDEPVRPGRLPQATYGPGFPPAEKGHGEQAEQEVVEGSEDGRGQVLQRALAEHRGEAVDQGHNEHEPRTPLPADGGERRQPGAGLRGLWSLQVERPGADHHQQHPDQAAGRHLFTEQQPAEERAEHRREGQVRQGQGQGTDADGGHIEDHGEQLQRQRQPDPAPEGGFRQPGRLDGHQRQEQDCGQAEAHQHHLGRGVAGEEFAGEHVGERLAEGAEQGEDRPGHAGLREIDAARPAVDRQSGGNRSKGLTALPFFYRY